MKQTSDPTKKAPAEAVPKDIRRATKRQGIWRLLSGVAQARIPFADWPKSVEQDGSDPR